MRCKPSLDPVRGTLLFFTCVLCAFSCAAQTAQPAASQPVSPAAEPQQPYTLRTGAQIVLVPTTVSIKGQIVYGLTADQFRILDNGVPQPVTLDDSVDSLGLSLVVVVQCSRMALMEYDKLQGLPDLIESIVGNAPHEVAMVRYGSHPELVQPFTRSLNKVADSMARMGPCEDDEAATRDAVSYANAILDNRDPRNRHAILLIGEARDHGSTVKEKDLIAQLGRSNTVVDSVAYSPGAEETTDIFKHFAGGNPFSLMMSAIQALRKNTAKSLAVLSGGDSYHFNNRNGFDMALLKLTNRVHNYYLLSFPVPRSAESGLHELQVSVPEYPHADIRARRSYYAGSDAPPASVE